MVRRVMLRKVLLLIGLVALAGSFFGCAHAKPADTPLVAPGDLSYEELHTTERFRKYKSVGIRLFDASDVAFLSTNAEERTEMEAFKLAASSHLINGFLEEMGDHKFYPKFGVANTKEEAAGYDLIIEGKFIQFDRGTRGARYLGTGGWTNVSLMGTMTETATGKVVVKFRDVKYGKGGSFGGDSMDLLRNNCVEIGSNISDFLEEVY
ncbi:MAG: hypothetical protein AABY79_07370 [Nitrospirota bacterium]|jgi:hypothetical protein